MAKKRTRKKGMKGVRGLLAWIIGIIVSFAIGGFFVSGMVMSAFLGIPLLNLIPQIVHTIIGWLIIRGTAVNVVLSFLK